MFKIVIIDDNFREAEMIQRMIPNLAKDMEISGIAYSVEEGIKLVKDSDPTLILLDVELPDGDGFDVLEATKNMDYRVAFITGHDHYTLQALRSQAYDYLTKPVKEDHFERMIQAAYTEYLRKAKEKLEQLYGNNDLAKERRMGIWTTEGMRFIDVNKITHIKAEGSYARIHIQGKRDFIATKLLKEFEFLCANDMFVRVHNSYMVNIRNVKSYSKKNGGTITLVTDKEVPVSRGRKEEVISKLGEWIL